MVDITALTALSRSDYEGFRRLLPQLGPAIRAISYGEMRELVETGKSILFAAREKGEMIGCLCLALYGTPTGGRAVIEDVVVDVARRREGIGKSLVEAAIHRVEELGLEFIDLTSHPRRVAANALYVGLGFAKRETNVYRLYFSREDIS